MKKLCIECGINPRAANSLLCTKCRNHFTDDKGERRDRNEKKNNFQNRTEKQES